ncbi:hypothetical protein IL306_005908 [Fusarium sp. DS 682]|nr:hypothetical protein IL306_005908 [Fusarium sp. DS 682]
MSQKRRDSIADDWLEVDSAASVISMDSRPSSPSPSPLLASPQETPAPKIQAIASFHDDASNTTSQSQIPLRPKDNAVESSHINFQEQLLFPTQDANAEKYVDPFGISSRSPFAAFQAQQSFPAKKPNTEKYDDSFNTSSRSQLPLRPEDSIVEPFPTFQEQQPETPSPQQSLVAEADAPDNEPSDPNPSDYHKACQHAAESLDTVAKLADDIGGHKISTMSLIRSTCEQLSTQATDLGKMHEVYAQHWASKGSSMALVDIPLNPDTWEVLSELKEVILQAHDALCSVTSPQDFGKALTAADIPLHANLELARCLEALEDIRDLFTEFLPILKADFDEFRTKHMGFATATPLDRHQKKLRHEAPDPKTSQIRDELYALKDRFVMINVFLSRLKDTHPSPNVTDPLVFKSLKHITQAISRVLTNNPSEWIESDMASSSNMSYAQFMTLDPDVLHDITSHLQDFQDELDFEARPGEDGCDYSQEMIHNHQEFLLLEGGQLQELRSVIEFTESILMMQG